MDVPEVVVPTYTVEELKTITTNLVALTSSIRSGQWREVRLSVECLIGLHRAAFQGVGGLAGRLRGPGFGSERLRFGTRYSSDRRGVAQELERLFREVHVRARELDEAGDTRSLEAVFALATYAHTEVIRIHPFEDGNGRSARLLLDVILVRYGLRPIAIEVPRKEYIDCLECAFERNPQPLIDLYIRLASDVLDDNSPPTRPSSTT